MATTELAPSVLKGLLTTEGLANCIRMANNGGWHVYPTKFAVTETMGDIIPSRTTLDMFPTWYSAPISGRIVQDAETIEFLCTIPPSQAATVKYIREIYLLAETTDGAEFLLGICGIDGTAVYDPAGSIKFRIVVRIQNLNLMDLFVFKYTQAMEIEDHNNDPNAHPDLTAAINGVGKPTYVYNNYAATEGQTLFVDSSSGPITIQLPRSGLRAGSKVEVFDVGWQCQVPGKEITIVSVDHTIDKRKAAFILNQKGAAVRFIYWPNLKGWVVDIEGRFTADIDRTVNTAATKLYYTDYLITKSVTNVSTSGNTTANVGDTMFVNTGNPNTTVTNPPKYNILLPKDPISGDTVTIIDSSGNFKNNPPLANGNGHTINGSNALYTMDQAYGVYTYYYDGVAKDWKVTVSTTKAKTTGGLNGTRKEQIFWSNLAAGTVLSVPEYEVGNGTFTVWLDGILCTQGSANGPTVQYAEIGTAGKTSTQFKFWDIIPAGMRITTLS